MSDRTESGLPRVVAIAWGIHAAPQRGPARALSHEQIVRRAVEIADEHGLAALTMQRLAESLGFTTMSLYRYVADKDELLMLMQAAAWLLPEEPALHEDWQDNLRSWARVLRDLYGDHPWLLEVLRGPTAVLMPSSVIVVDWGLRAIQDLSLDSREKIAVILAISSYVSSFAALDRDLARQEELDLGPEAMAELGEVFTPDRLPFLAPLMLEGGYVGGSPGDESVDFEFDFGLKLFVEGLGAQQARLSPTGPSPRPSAPRTRTPRTRTQRP